MTVMGNKYYSDDRSTFDGADLGRSSNVFRPPNALLCGCLAVQWMSDGCFEHPSTTSVEDPWDCPVLCGTTFPIHSLFQLIPGLHQI